MFSVCDLGLEVLVLCLCFVVGVGDISIFL